MWTAQTIVRLLILILYLLKVHLITSGLNLLILKLEPRITTQQYLIYLSLLFVNLLDILQFSQGYFPQTICLLDNIISLKRIKPFKRYVYNYKDAEIDGLQELLNYVPWDIVYDENDMEFSTVRSLLLFRSCDFFSFFIHFNCQFIYNLYIQICIIKVE